MIAAVRFSSESTSGRAGVAMKPWTKAVYVSLMRRRDSAAIVSNTSELFPDPDTPVKTVSFRFGMSIEMSRRLFSRAPRTRIAPHASLPSRFWTIGPIVPDVAPVSRRRWISGSTSAGQLGAEDGEHGRVATMATARRGDRDR
jgi:hypothetical protein